MHERFDALDGRTRSLSDWSDATFDEAAHWRWIDSDLTVLNLWLAPIKLLALLLDDRFDQALELAERVRPVTAVMPTSYFTTYFEFLHALAAALGPGDAREQLARDLIDFDRRARACPANYAHQAALLRALLAAEDGRAAEVARLRFFAGLEVADVARALEVSERTVMREWAYARARLTQLLG